MPARKRGGEAGEPVCAVGAVGRFAVFSFQFAVAEKTDRTNAEARRGPEVTEKINDHRQAVIEEFLLN